MITNSTAIRNNSMVLALKRSDFSKLVENHLHIPNYFNQFYFSLNPEMLNAKNVCLISTSWSQRIGDTTVVVSIFWRKLFWWFEVWYRFRDICLVAFSLSDIRSANFRSCRTLGSFRFWVAHTALLFGCSFISPVFSCRCHFGTKITHNTFIPFGRGPESSPY